MRPRRHFLQNYRPRKPLGQILPGHLDRVYLLLNVLASSQKNKLTKKAKVLSQIAYVIDSTHLNLYIINTSFIIYTRRFEFFSLMIRSISVDDSKFSLHEPTEYCKTPIKSPPKNFKIRKFFNIKKSQWYWVSLKVLVFLIAPFLLSINFSSQYFCCHNQKNHVSMKEHTVF